jgi:DNA-binding NarL/FixJ family response regulator
MTLVSEGFKALLAKVKGIKIVKIVKNGQILLKYLQENTIDLIIMDVMMPVMDGLEATKIIKKKYPRIKVLMLSVSHKPFHVQTALEAGADGYLLKETNKKELVNAILRLMDGKTYYAQKVTKTLIGLPKIKESTKILLSQREHEILLQLSIGGSSKEIAIKLNVSESTIKTHRKNLLKKFGVGKMVLLIRKAMKGGYL